MAEVTHAQSNLNTVLGALGTAAFAGVNASGGIGGLLGGGNKPEYATKSDLENAILLAQKDNEISLLKSESNTEVKVADVYARLKGDMLAMERNQHDWNTQQSLNNCQMSSAIAANASSIAILQAMTKTVIPITNVCPQPAVATPTTTTPST